MMNKNKKLLVVGASVAVGCAILVTTAFASMSGETGYSTYKEAIKKTSKVQSLAGDIKVTFTDNGEVKSELDADIKSNMDTGDMSSKVTVKVGDKEQSMETYAKDGKTVIKNSKDEAYTVLNRIDSRTGRAHKFSRSQFNETEATKVGEMVIDAVVGNLKNYVELDKKADGESTVSLNLSGNQIPAVVNAVTSLAIRSAEIDAHKAKSGTVHSDIKLFDQNMDPNLPELVTDIRIEKVYLKADISKDQLIENQLAQVVISGKDKSGLVHDLALNVNADMSGYNATTPDTVDLTGKKVKELDKEQLKEQIKALEKEYETH